MTAVAAQHTPHSEYLLGTKNQDEGSSSSSSGSSTSSVSVPSRPPLFQRSASSPSMNHCWQLKTTLTAGVTPLQPIIKEIKTSKDDTDISPEDIIVDPKTHHTFRKGRLIGKGGFAKVRKNTSKIMAENEPFPFGLL